MPDNRGTQNRLAREYKENEFRLKLFAQTPVGPISRQQRRYIARLAAQADLSRRKKAARKLKGGSAMIDE